MQHLLWLEAQSTLITCSGLGWSLPDLAKWTGLSGGILRASSDDSAPRLCDVAFRGRIVLPKQDLFSLWHRTDAQKSSTRLDA
jgi:hypothetical protein